MKYTKEYLRDNEIAIKFLSNGDYNFLNKFYQIGINLTMNQAIICYKRNGIWSWDDDITAFDGYTIIDSDVIISEIKKPDNRKLLGYKAPFDTFKLERETIVRKGDIYVKDYIRPQDNGYLLREDLFAGRTKTWTVNVTFLPAEIVEQWEPVYEEEKPTFGSFSDIIKHFEGCKVVAESGDYILISNETKFAKSKGLIHHHLSIEIGWNFTDSFQSELKQLGIKI